MLVYERSRNNCHFQFGEQLRSSGSPVPVARATGKRPAAIPSLREAKAGFRSSGAWTPKSSCPEAVASGTGLLPLCGWRSNRDTNSHGDPYTILLK